MYCVRSAYDLEFCECDHQYGGHDEDQRERLSNDFHVSEWVHFSFGDSVLCRSTESYAKPESYSSSCSYPEPNTKSDSNCLSFMQYAELNRESFGNDLCLQWLPESSGVSF